MHSLTHRGVPFTPTSLCQVHCWRTMGCSVELTLFQASALKSDTAAPVSTSRHRGIEAIVPCTQ